MSSWWSGFAVEKVYTSLHRIAVALEKLVAAQEASAAPPPPPPPAEPAVAADPRWCLSPEEVSLVRNLVRPTSGRRHVRVVASILGATSDDELRAALESALELAYFDKSPWHTHAAALARWHRRVVGR